MDSSQYNTVECTVGLQYKCFCLIFATELLMAMLKNNSDFYT